MGEQPAKDLGEAAREQTSRARRRLFTGLTFFALFAALGITAALEGLGVIDIDGSEKY